MPSAAWQAYHAPTVLLVRSLTHKRLRQTIAPMTQVQLFSLLVVTIYLDQIGSASDLPVSLPVIVPPIPSTPWLHQVENPNVRGEQCRCDQQDR
jgi:hypothetical protein